MKKREEETRPMTSIRRVTQDRELFMPLLLLGDEQLSMIRKYMDTGELFALYDGETPCAVCVVQKTGAAEVEIRNLAVDVPYRRRGYGRALIEYVCREVCPPHGCVIAATGDSPLTVPFYEKCGFTRSHRIPNFFTDRYDHPIYEAGVQLVDMVYLQRNL